MNVMCVAVLSLALIAAGGLAQQTNAPAPAVVTSNATTGAISNTLPTTITIDGVSYQNVRWGTVTISTVSIMHSTGVVTIPLARLPPGLQRQLGYDPQREAALMKRRAEEQKRLEAATTAAKVAAQVMLEGQDLVAWKLARQAAERQCRILSEPPSVPVPYGPAVQGSGAAYAATVNAHYAATSERHELHSEPRQGYMRKTVTGDWTFFFPVKSSYYNVEKKAYVTRWEQMVVQVTNYDNEMRVENISSLQPVEETKIR